MLWNTPNGGSVGDGHGRYDGITLAAIPGQWKVGDYFCLVRTEPGRFFRYFNSGHEIINRDYCVPSYDLNFYHY